MGNCLCGDTIPIAPKEVQEDPTMDEVTPVVTMLYGVLYGANYGVYKQADIDLDNYESKDLTEKAWLWFNKHPYIQTPEEKKAKERVNYIYCDLENFKREPGSNIGKVFWRALLPADKPNKKKYQECQYESNTPCPEEGKFEGILHDAAYYDKLISDDDVIRGYNGRGCDLTVHLENKNEENLTRRFKHKISGKKGRCETEYKMTRWCYRNAAELQLGDDLGRETDKYQGIKSFSNPGGEPMKLEFFAHGRCATTWEVCDMIRRGEGGESKSTIAQKRECRYVDVSEYRLTFKGETIAEWEFDGGSAFPPVWEGISGGYSHAVGEQPRSSPFYDYSIEKGHGLIGKEATHYTPKGGWDPTLSYMLAHIHSRTFNHLNLLGNHFWPNTPSDPCTMVEKMRGYPI